VTEFTPPSNDGPAKMMPRVDPEDAAVDTVAFEERDGLTTVTVTLVHKRARSMETATSSGEKRRAGVDGPSEDLLAALARIAWPSEGYSPPSVAPSSAAWSPAG
jgi:hypothetical protein